MMRRRSRTTRYLGEREARGRVALDNAARSEKTDAHNRRKPTVGGTGTPELASGAVTNEKVNDVSAAKVNQGTLDNARLSGRVLLKSDQTNRAPKTDLPDDTVYGSATGRVRAAQDIDWGEGKPVPPGKVGNGYKYEDLADKPSLGKFLTRNDVKASALK